MLLLLLLTGIQAGNGRLLDEHFISIVVASSLFVVVQNHSVQKLTQVLAYASLAYTLPLLLELVYRLQGLASFPQVAGIIHANPNTIAVTGAAFLPFTLYYFLGKYKHKTSVCILLICYALPLVWLNSRTALLMLLVQAIAGLYWNRKLTYAVSIKSIQISGRYLIGIIAIGLISLFLYLMQLKTGSTTGRWFILQLTLQHTLEKNGVWGNGIGSFAVDYIDWQAAYFAKKGDSDTMAQVAGNTHLALNEYLQALYEIGWVGLLSLLVFIFLPLPKLVRQGQCQLTLQPFILSLVSIAVSAHTFYVLHLFSVLCLLFSILAVLYHKATWHNPLPRWLYTIRNTVWISSGLLLLCFLSQQLWAVINWQKAHQAKDKRPVYALRHYKKAFRHLYHHSVFTHNYASVLAEQELFKESNEVIQASLLYYKSSDTYYVLGQNAARELDYPQALAYYHQAHRIYPAKLLPLFSLAGTHLQQNNTDSAMYYYKRVINKKVKVHTPLAVTIQEESRRIVDSLENPKRL